MTITTRPTHTGPSLLGGSIDVPVNPCLHETPRSVQPWTGEPGTVGAVALVGAGKMGLPLAAQFASHGWQVTAVDVNEDVVVAINEGRSHVGEEPGLVESVAAAHAAGRLRATTDGTAAARAADVVVIIVPVMLDERHQPDYRYMDAAAAAVGPGLHAGSLVIFETTLPVGDTRGRYQPALEAASGLTVEKDLFVAFSPERLLSGHVFQNLATYPKLVGGLGPASTARAAAFYASTLDAEVVAMSSAEAAEFSKLAETTYRDVNIALANEYANYAERAGVDILEVIAASNSQPYSHIH
ncbi:MAG: nucleotide sugar dehydrogenase, partial [Candidatus Limnocylindrales bacterium]